jgi:hypothetical protein
MRSSVAKNAGNGFGACFRASAANAIIKDTASALGKRKEIFDQADQKKDERAARLNISRQAVIKTLLGRALNEEREHRLRSKNT